MSEWISVNDRLPKEFEDVLVCAINEYGETYEKGEKYLALDRMVRWMDKTPTSFRTDRYYGKVTHWMPLPDSPKEEME